MKLVYVAQLNGYIDLESEHYPGEVYTEDDLDMFVELESKWRESIPDYNFYELLKIYPSAKSAMKRSLVARIKDLKSRRKKFIAHTEEQQIKIFGKLTPKEQIEVEDILRKENEEFLDELKKEEQKLVKQKEYLNRLIRQDKLNEKLEKAKKKNDEQKILEAEAELMETVDTQNKEGISEEMIVRAKEIPITNFVKVGRDGKTKCLKHNERTPSMHVYKRKNNFYCFSCGFHGSVIDIVMLLQGLDFKEAVKYLNNV